MLKKKYEEFQDRMFTYTVKHWDTNHFNFNGLKKENFFKGKQEIS